MFMCVYVPKMPLTWLECCHVEAQREIEGKLRKSIPVQYTLRLIRYAVP